MSKKSKAKAKAAPKGKRSQGKPAETGSLGMGDSYAYAVGNLTPDKSGEESWLGVSKKTIDPLASTGDVLHGKKRK